MLLFTREWPNLKIVFFMVSLNVLTLFFITTKKALLAKSPESRCCKRVRDGGVDGVVVAMIVTAGQQLQLEYLQHPGKEEDQ